MKTAATPIQNPKGRTDNLRLSTPPISMVVGGFLISEARQKAGCFGFPLG
jgi:hypothetical protein